MNSALQKKTQSLWSTPSGALTTPIFLAECVELNFLVKKRGVKLKTWSGIVLNTL
jgi:hypothetical protein